MCREEKFAGGKATGVHRHSLRLIASLIAPFIQKFAGGKAAGVHRHSLRH